MSDSIELPDGSFVPIQGTVCECNHWYDEHAHSTDCMSPGCDCGGFLADPEASTPEAIAERGGARWQWPEHVGSALGYYDPPTVLEGTVFDPFGPFGPILGALQAGEFGHAAALTRALALQHGETEGRAAWDRTA